MQALFVFSRPASCTIANELTWIGLVRLDAGPLNYIFPTDSIRTEESA
jgi:hypothetical protein